MMKVIFFGLGSIGRRRARILLDNSEHRLFAFRSTRKGPSNDLGIKEIYTWKEVESLRPDVAFITNPTSMHVKTALKCASLGLNMFIEKPLSNTLYGVSSLKEACRKRCLTCYTSYCLRFHPVIKKIRELIKGKKIYHIRVVCSSYLPAWRPDQDYRKSYSSSLRKGGGVLLDLSHELDYIQFLFGEIKTAKVVYSRVSNLTVDAEDFADLLLTLNNGIHVNLHLNFFSRINERSLKVDFAEGHIIGDLLESKVHYLYRSKKKTFKFPKERDDYLKEEIKYFFDNIGNPKIMNGPEESNRFLKKTLEFKHG